MPGRSIESELRLVPTKLHSADARPAVRKLPSREGNFNFSRDEATKARNFTVFFYRMVRTMETRSSYQVDPESVDSLFRKAGVFDDVRECFLSLMPGECSIENEGWRMAITSRPAEVR